MSINGLTLAVPNQAHQIQHYSRYILILCIPRTRAPRGFSRIAWWFEAVRDWRWPLGVNHYAQNTQVMQPPQLQARQIAGKNVRHFGGKVTFNTFYGGT
jgi:hypothetical protein